MTIAPCAITRMSPPLTLALVSLLPYANNDRMVGRGNLTPHFRFICGVLLEMEVRTLCAGYWLGLYMHPKGAGSLDTEPN